MYGPVDAVCFIFAIIAIVLWFVTNDPVLAIVMSVIADCIATIPTYVKTYREPFSESTASWLVCIIASGFALISASPFNVANIIFPTYMVIAGVVFLYVMMIRRHTVRPRASQT
jgi:energy-coupling factor transporter transmembrane protein EcfT